VIPWKRGRFGMGCVFVRRYGFIIAALLLSRHLEKLRLHTLGVLENETLEEGLAKALAKKNRS